MFKNPINWAKEAVEQHGWDHALKIANVCKRPGLGEDNSFPNPMLAYWTNAFLWMVKRAPKKAIEDLARKIAASAH